jgi:hypothetical protein
LPKNVPILGERDNAVSRVCDELHVVYPGRRRETRSKAVVRGELQDVPNPLADRL